MPIMARFLRKHTHQTSYRSLDRAPLPTLNPSPSYRRDSNGLTLSDLKKQMPIMVRFFRKRALAARVLDSRAWLRPLWRQAWKTRPSRPQWVQGWRRRKCRHRKRSLTWSEDDGGLGGLGG